VPATVGLGTYRIEASVGGGPLVVRAAPGAHVSTWERERYLEVY
jgi:hypothetical protein